MTEFMLRVQTDRLAPEVQARDTLLVREQDHADPGDLVVVNVDGDAVLRKFEPGMTVLGLIISLYRRVPGASS